MEQKQLKNKVNQKVIKNDKKISTTPIRDAKNQKFLKYSPIKSKQPQTNKVKVVVNNLDKKEEPYSRFREYNRSRSP